MENELTEVVEQEQVTEEGDDITQLKEQVNAISAKLEDQLKQSQEKELELNQTLDSINLTAALGNENLIMFKGLFELTDNEERVAFLKNAVNQILVSNSYQPKSQAKQEQYEQAISNGDVNSAIKFKLSKLFGKWGRSN